MSEPMQQLLRHKGFTLKASAMQITGEGPEQGKWDVSLQVWNNTSHRNQDPVTFPMSLAADGQKGVEAAIVWGVEQIDRQNPKFPW